jgi:hypothetical protein
MTKFTVGRVVGFAGFKKALQVLEAGSRDGG